MDQQLLREFLAEAEELVESLFGDIRLLRERGGDGRARRELLARIFRHVHTIKGSSAAAGLDAISRLAHEFETLLDAVRSGRAASTNELLEVAEATVESIAAQLSAAARGDSNGAPHKLIERLRQLSLAGGEETRGADAASALPESVAGSLGEHERQRIREASDEGAHLYVLTVDFDLADFDESFRDLSNTLMQKGEIISTLPGVPASGADGVNFRIVYATDEGRESVTSLVELFGATLLDETQDAEATASADVERLESEGTVDEAGAPALSSLTMLVRVPLEELDELISDTHELFNETTNALALSLENLPAGGPRDALDARASSVRRRFRELEEHLIALRMVTLRATLERAARVGARVARGAGRDVEFETRGGSVRLDKSLAELLSEPLLHLLRNAVDHGIEGRDERRAAGKPARGRICLEAAADGNRVVLRITDDGRGIDPERVTHAAQERGLISPDKQVSEQQALRLIFRPGFSTAEELSSVSGRGVGLDVVERAIEHVGGEMRVWSRKGEGTTFEMRVPTTLALLRSLVVRAGGERYCIAAGHVAEAGRAETSDMSGVGDAGTLRLRGEELPLVNLRSLLEQKPRDDQEGHDTAFVVSHVARRGRGDAESEGPRLVAVAFEDVEGEGDVLVRSLGRHAAQWRGVSGATEMPDGTVALVLDLPHLLEMYF